MTIEIQPIMKEIFVVDADDLKIQPALVLSVDWEHKDYIVAKIGNHHSLISKGGWTKDTTYAGFETEKEAQDFKEFQEAVNKAA